MGAAAAEGDAVSRAAILSKVRAALKVKPGSDAAPRLGVDARLAASADHPVPQRGRVTGPERVALFKLFLAAQATDLIELSDAAEIPQAIAEYLAAHRLGLRVRSGADPLFAALPWREVRGLERQTGPAQASDTAGLSRALCGVAETGTLVLASGPDNPTTLAFLPETHIVVLCRDAICGTYEEAVARVAAELASGALPHTLNLVTGASRTGDIGGRIVRGAHGPRRLAVILLGGGQ
jgi:L-lactate dehydrogenase complex protein LldG